MKDKDKQAIKFDKIGKNEIAVFEYIPISEVVDEYTVDINVKGVDKLGNELYSYRVNRPKDSGKYTVNAFKLSGYKLDGADNKEVIVGNKDIQVTFEYESLDQLVTIKAVDESGDPIKDFTEIKVMSQKGNKFSYNAPHIKGWNLNDDITKVIDVDENTNTITFKYKKASGNVDVVLKEEDGRFIKTFSESVKIGEEKTITAPPLETYTIVGSTNKKVSYSEDKQVVEFVYKKATRKVDLALYDISDKDNHKLLSTETLTSDFRVGEVAEITAPSQKDMTLVGDLRKIIVLESGTGNQKVRFDYRSTREDEITIEAIEKETGLILQSTSVKADVGTSMKINAPIFDTHKLSEGELGTKTVKAGEKASFNYDRNTVEVTREAKDKSGNKIELPIGVQSKFEAVRGKDFTAYAPHIPGYVLLNQANNTVKFNKIAKAETATFIYQSISEVVDEYTVDINVKGVDKLGNELYSYRVNRPKDSGKYTVNAFNLSGYKLDGAETKEVTVGKKDIQVTFEYESLDQLVTIKAVDENNQAIADFTEIKVMSQKGNKFSYNAPHIKGWNLNDDITKVIDVDETTNTITFKYKHAVGNIEVVLKEEDGKLIKTLSDNVTVTDKEKTIIAPDLSTSNYTLKGPEDIKVKYSEDHQSVEFIYTKDLREVSIRSWDISEGKPGKQIGSSVIYDKFRVGEVATLIPSSYDNMILIGKPIELVVVESDKTSENPHVKNAQMVDVTYRSTKEDEIVIEAKESISEIILQSTIVKANVGTSMKIDAPIFDTHKLSKGELATQTVKAGGKATFKYDKNIVTVTREAKDKSGNKIELPVGVQSKFEAVRGKDFTAYAPHISGYVLLDQSQNKKVFNKIDKNEVAEFIYQPISEVVTDHVVDVKVTGKDEKGNELYSYKVQRPKNSGQYKVMPFEQSNYELLDNKQGITVNVKDTDMFVEFKYKNLKTLVKIGAYYKDGSKDIEIPTRDYTPVEVEGIRGNKFGYTAPYIQGWNLKGNLSEEIDVVEGKNEIKFYYEKAIGNVDVILKEKDGPIIKSISKNVDIGGNIELDPNATEFKIENYTLVPNQNKVTVSYKNEKQIVTFEYTKDTQNVKVELYDITNSPQGIRLNESFELKGQRVGEYITVSAPSIENLAISGDYSKVYKVDKNNNSIRFNYKSTQAGKILLEAVDQDGKILQSTVIEALKGTSMKIDAPVFKTHILADGETPTKIAHSGDKVIFNYKENTVKISISLKHGEEDLSIKYPGLAKDIDVVKHTDATIFAPHIPGYVIDGTGKVEFKDIDSDKTAEFKYKAISEVVDEHTVYMDVVGEDSIGRELYRYNVKLPKNSGKKTVTAFDLYGYKLKGDKNKEVEVKENNIEVKFVYDSLRTEVVIRAVDEQGRKIREYTEETVEAQEGNPFTYLAPYIPGWTLTSDSTIGHIDKVESTGNVLTFKYKQSEGNVTVLLKEKLTDGTTRIIKSFDEEVKVENITNPKRINPVDLSADYYELASPQYIDVYYKDGENQTIEFIYTKKMKTVKMDLMDVTNTPEVKIKEQETTNKYRMGEVGEVKAPILDGEAKRYSLVGDVSKLVLVKDDTVVRFNYKSLEDKESVVRAIEDQTNILLQEFIMTINDGEKITVSAPEFESHKLKEGQEKIKDLEAGKIIDFVYVKNTSKISIKAEDKDGKNVEFVPGTKTVFEAIKGQSYIVYAPHIPGYVLENIREGSKEIPRVTKDEEVIFKYIPVSDIVDEYTVDINVKGEDENGLELYSYRINRPRNFGKYLVNAFNQSGYEIIGDSSKEIDIQNKDINVVFKHKSLDQIVTIKAVEENNQEIKDFTEIKVLGRKNSPFSYNAPHIKGWNLNDEITKVIDVDETTNTITFKYKKASGNVEVVLKEEDGRVIKTLSDNVTVADKEKTITAPTLETYTIVGESSKKVSYSEDKQVVEFIYKKNLVNIKVVPYDITDSEQGQKLDIHSYEIKNQRSGEVIEIKAKDIDKYYLVGDLSKLVKVNNTNSEIRFDYKSSKKNEIVVKAVEKASKELLQSTVVSVDAGTRMRINAPEFETHKLVAGSDPIVLAKDGDTVVFEYERNTVKVTIKAKDKSGKPVELPVGVEGEFEAVRGKDFTAYAPHIPGYVLLDQANNTVKFNKIAEAKTATFIYQSISEVVDEYTVDINVKGVDKLGNELYSYRVNRPKGSGDYTVNAFNLSGYKLNGADNQKVPVGKKDIQVTFEYESLDQLVTIKAVDENDQAIADFTEIKVMSQRKNKFSYNAPHIKGWNLNDDITKVIDVDENTNTITFKYKKASGNVEVVLKEEDGRVIKTLSDNVTVADKEKTITAPTLETYTIVGESSKKVSYSEDKQVVEFIYKKATRKVDLTLYDVSDEDNHKPISTKSLTDEFRVGEVAKVTAPAVDNMMLVENSVKLVEIGKGAGNQNVRFDYKSTQKDEIVIEAVEKETGLILQSTSVEAGVGTSMKINAPIFDTHKLSQGELGTKTVKAGEKVTFNYDKNTVKVTIEAKDKSGNKIELPIGVEGKFDAVRGKDFTAYAPHIPGYVLLDQANNTVKFNKIAKMKQQHLSINQYLK